VETCNRFPATVVVIVVIDEIEAKKKTAP